MVERINTATVQKYDVMFSGNRKPTCTNSDPAEIHFK
jgi:hypothetical protein